MAPRSTSAAIAAIALSAAGAVSLAAILAEVAAAEAGETLMTQEQAAEGIAAGYLEADTTRAADGLAPVKLTDAGFAKFKENEANPAPAPAPKTAMAFKVSNSVPPPTDEGVRRGRSNGYPFATMEVNDSFHVVASAQYPDPAERLASSVSGARARFAEETGETEEVEVKTYKKGADGKFLKDADGKRIVESTATETKPKMRITKDFIVRAVDESDPEGVGARVWRIA